MTFNSALSLRILRQFKDRNLTSNSCGTNTGPMCLLILSKVENYNKDRLKMILTIVFLTKLTLLTCSLQRAAHKDILMTLESDQK